MLGLFFNPFRALAGPLAVIAGISALCICFKCFKCRMRDCHCIKRFLRCIGYDEFDEFELMILVHEALFDSKENKGPTSVRVTAGAHSVKTDQNSNAIFQQPLHIVVEQGTEEVVVDLLDQSRRVVATLPLPIMGHILHDDMKPEHVYAMKTKKRDYNNTKIKLTIIVSQEGDVEKALFADIGSDLDILVRQQLKKAAAEGKHAGEGELSEMEVLKQACSGPLELFEGLGNTNNVYVSILGPPVSRRWVLGIWHSQKDFENKKRAMMEVDLLKIETVSADPMRKNVFIINCFDESRVRKSLTFRRIDRARDVWVEILHLLVVKARDAKRVAKTQTFSKSPSRQTISDGHGRSPRSPSVGRSPRATQKLTTPTASRHTHSYH